MTVPTQSGANGDGGQADGASNDGGDGGSQGSNQQPDSVDLKAISGDQLNQVFENPELWKHPRFKELSAQAAEAKKLREAQSKAEEEALANEKKFEELANKRAEENQRLQEQIQTNSVNQALTTALYKVGVIDLDGALKLVDRTKVTVSEDGQITGVDEALESLKTDKPYLFSEDGSAPNVGGPVNQPGAQQPSTPGRYKFKESQLTPDFYKEHQKEVDEAWMQGLIEQDGPPR